MNDKPVVLITGATGFVGSHVLKAMKEAPVELIAACRKPEKLPEWFKGEVRSGDFRDQTYVDTLPVGVDIVIHAAAWTSMYGHRSIEEERYLKPTLHFLDAVESAGVSRFVFPSSHGAAPIGKGQNALSEGVGPAYWPHLQVVVAIENEMRKRASDKTTMVNMRLGLFVGENYSLGLLPILTHRLKTHLVPWVDGGSPPLPLIDGADIGQAIRKAALEPSLSGFESFNIIGPSVPTMRELVTYLNKEYGYPKPHFSVPSWIAFPFAKLMRAIDPLVPWDPLIVPAIVHLLQDFRVDNAEAIERLHYQPIVPWKKSVDRQLVEMGIRQQKPMRLRKSLN
jgi:nucleoside-diphosphate-sugar epimerase